MRIHHSIKTIKIVINTMFLLTFKGIDKNINGIGTTLHLYYNDKQQFYQHYPTRGYLSTDDPRPHFGLGVVTKLDSIVIEWPDNKSQVIMNVDVDKTISIDYKNAVDQKISTPVQQTVFTDVSKKYNINFKPKERDFIDYTIQPTIAHKLSQYGPGIAVGDIDNNGFEDFYIGGSSGNSGVFFMQGADGKFTIDSSRIVPKDDPLHEDMGVLFFDADGDKDLDVYMVSGSYEIPPNHPISNDRLFHE